MVNSLVAGIASARASQSTIKVGSYMLSLAILHIPDRSHVSGVVVVKY